MPDLRAAPGLGQAAKTASGNSAYDNPSGTWFYSGHRTFGSRLGDGLAWGLSQDDQPERVGFLEITARLRDSGS